MAKKKKYPGMIVTADGREITSATIAKRMAQPGVGSPGISATLPGATTLPVRPDQPGTQPTAGSALMGAQVSLPPMSPDPSNPYSGVTDPFKVAAGKSRSTLAKSATDAGIRVTPNALNPNSPYAGQSGMQGGAMKVVPDSARSEKWQAANKDTSLADGFGPGNYVPSDAALSLQKQFGAQRQANATQKNVTTPGGPGGVPGGGEAALYTTTRPEFQAATITVNGKARTVAAPAAEKYNELVGRLSKAAAMAATESAAEVGGLGEPMAIQKAQMDARKAMTDEERSFMAAAESGANLGYKKANTGRINAATGEALPDTYTIATPKKQTTKSGAPKIPGRLTHDFKKIDKAITSTTSPTMVDKHLASILGQSEEVQAVIEAQNPKFAAFQAASRLGATYEEARLMAYGVNPHKSFQISDSLKLAIASQYTNGIEIVGDQEIPDPRDSNKKLIIKVGTGSYTSLPWNKVLDPEDSNNKKTKFIEDPAKLEKAMAAAYGHFNKRMIAYNVNPKDIPKLFHAALVDTGPGKPELSPENEAIWQKFRSKLDAPISVGEKSAKVLNQQSKSPVQTKPTIGSHGEKTPPRNTPPKKKESDSVRVITSLIAGNTQITAENSPALAQSISDFLQSGEMTEEQAEQLKPIFAKVAAFMAENAKQESQQTPTTQPSATTQPAQPEPTTQPVQTEPTFTPSYDPASGSTQADISRKIQSATDQVSTILHDPSKTSDDVVNEIDRLAKTISDDPDVQQIFRDSVKDIEINPDSPRKETGIDSAGMREERSKKWAVSAIDRITEFVTEPSNSLAEISKEIDRLAPIISSDPEIQLAFKAEAAKIAMKRKHIRAIKRITSFAQDHDKTDKAVSKEIERLAPIVSDDLKAKLTFKREAAAIVAKIR